MSTLHVNFEEDANTGDLNGNRHRKLGQTADRQNDRTKNKKDESTCYVHHEDPDVEMSRRAADLT